jgi:hypothetical protein
LDAGPISRSCLSCGALRERTYASGTERRYFFNHEVVVFWRKDGDTRIRCEISEEALDDHFGGDRKDELKAFLDHQRGIEEIARRKYLSGQLERDGSILIHTNEL